MWQHMMKNQKRWINLIQTVDTLIYTRKILAKIFVIFFAPHQLLRILCTSEPRQKNKKMQDSARSKNQPIFFFWLLDVQRARWRDPTKALKVLAWKLLRDANGLMIACWFNWHKCIWHFSLTWFQRCFFWFFLVFVFVTYTSSLGCRVYSFDLLVVFDRS